MKDLAVERARRCRHRVGRLSVCGLAWIANGCALATPRVWHWAGPEIQAVGVHHAAAEERNDQLYVEVQHVQGVDTGTYSLDVPFDWQGLPRHLDHDGVLATDTLIAARLARASPHVYVSGHLRVTGSDLSATPTRDKWSPIPNRFYGVQKRQGRTRSLTMTTFGVDTVSNRWVRLGSDSVGRETGMPFLRKCAAVIVTPATVVFDTIDVLGVLILWMIHPS